MKLSKRNTAIQLLRKNEKYLECPICRTDIRLTPNGSLTCVSGHNFDISSKGYVNFINSNKKTTYERDLFISRKEIFRLGYYDVVSEKICGIINELTADQDYVNILDVGCGEGFYSYRIGRNPVLSRKCSLFAVDLSKEAINLATQYESEVIWCVADLVKLPLSSNSMDIIVDVLTPANYAEFKRVLKNDGYIIKVIPGSDYLREIRDLMASQLIRKEYTNRETTEHTEKNIAVAEKISVNYRLPLRSEDLIHFLKMTPLTYGKMPDFTCEKMPDSITVQLEIIAGKIN